jgi:hypothetical protein
MRDMASATLSGDAIELMRDGRRAQRENPAFLLD